MKLNRSYGKALAVRWHPASSACGIIEADCTKINRSYGKAIASAAYPASPVCRTFSSFHPQRNLSRLHETQPLARQSSCCLLHIKLVPPVAKPKRTTRSSTACTAELSVRCTSSSFHLLRKRNGSQNSNACTAKLLLSATHQARYARCKTEADCTKINRSDGKAIAVCCISG